MIRHRSVFSRLLAGLVLMAGCLSSAAVSAQDLASQVPSLKWIPANAGTYSAVLRNREQLDILLKSNAVAKLMAMPGMQQAMQQLDQEWANPFGPLGEFRKWYAQPLNAELIEIVKDLASEEMFVYTDKNTAEFAAFLQEINQSRQFAPLAMLMKEGPLGVNRDPLFQSRVMLQTLNDNTDRLKFPDVVIGFKLTKTKPAQLAKLIDGMLLVAGQLAPPPLQGRLKKAMIHGSDVHLLPLDGSMVPWDMVPLNQFEDVPGQFDKLRKKLKELKVTFAVSVRDNYLLFSLGEGTAGLQALGAPGKRLIDRPEFAPLVKFGDRRLVSLGYASKEYLNVGNEVNVDETVKWLDSLLRESNLTAAQQGKIKKDIRNMLVDLKRHTPEIGAQLGFTFLNKRGYEGYHYDWSKNHGLDSTKPLTVLDHLGGQPIGFIAGRSPPQTDGYKDFVKFVKLAHQYFEEFGVPEMPRAEKAIYQQFMAQAMPYFARLDKATGTKLLPSLEGQGAWVLDARLKLKLPGINKPMPVPEFGIVAGLNDAGLFREGMTEYREVFNGLIDIVAKLVPPGADLPDFKIPAPKVVKAMGGALYSWPLPAIPGLDPKLMPTGGVSAKVAVFAISQEHALRLLTKNPFKMDGGPLGDTKKPLAEAAHFNFAALVDAAVPWVDFALAESGEGQATIIQVHTALEILKCLRGYTSATYVEQGAVVTHHETVFRDLEK